MYYKACTNACSYYYCGDIIYLGAGLEDFIAVSTNATLTPSLRRQCVSISVIPDNIFEPHETFTVVLSRNVLPSYVVLSPDVARVTIFDP